MEQMNVGQMHSWSKSALAILYSQVALASLLHSLYCLYATAIVNFARASWTTLHSLSSGCITTAVPLP